MECCRWTGSSGARVRCVQGKGHSQEHARVRAKGSRAESPAKARARSFAKTWSGVAGKEHDMGRPYCGGGSRGLCRGQDSLLKVGKTAGWRPKVAMVMCGVECKAALSVEQSQYMDERRKICRGGVSPCTEKSVAASALRLCVVCVCVYGYGSCIGAAASEEDEASRMP